MTADAKECNGGCEEKKVEFEGKAGLGVVLEGDRKGKEDYNSIACREGEESGGDGSEASFVMVNEDSDDPAERDLDLGGKVESVDAEESGRLLANVDPSTGKVAAGDRETGGGKGGDHEEGVDSIVNSETCVEDRKDAAAVSVAKEEKIESVTDTAVEAEESKGKEVNVQYDSESNNGVANNDAELEGERKEEIVVTESELQVVPESVVELEKKPEGATTETDDQIRSEPIVEVEERQEPETVITESDHRAELESAIEVDDRQVVETVGAEIKDRLESESAVVVETQEPQIMPTEKNNQEQSEAVAHVEEKLELMTLVTETKGQAELQSAVQIELKEETETTTDAGNQAVPEAIIEAGEEQKPKDTLTSQSLLVDHGKVRLSDVAEEDLADECLAESAHASEGQCGTSLQTADSSKSPESHEASTICHLDGKVKEAKSSSDPQNLENSSVCHVGNHELVKEVEVSNKSAENGETGPIEIETNIQSSDKPGPSGPVSVADLELELIDASVKSVVEGENVLGQRKESMVVCSNNDTRLETKVCNDAKIEKDVSPDHAVSMKLEPEIRNDSAEIGEHFVSSVEDDQATRKDDDEEPIHKAVEGIKEIQAPQEDSGGSTLDGERVDTQVVKWQPCYIIRVPRFTNEEIWTQIQNAQLELEEKTRSRESIRVAVQKRRATCNEYREMLETAKAKERAARAACGAKRQEIESVQAILNKLKNATSIEEIDNKIAAMDHEFQHSTMGLKEEKQHLQNIKQLRHIREQLSSNMGPKSEIDVAFDQRDQIEERFKTLKRELDSLKADLTETERKGQQVRKEYDDEVRHLRDLQEQFRAADEVRQKAYGHWRDLKKQSADTNKYFHMYKDDQKAVANYVTSRDREGLQLHCSKQVEKIMELWNNNDEFRMQYVKSNMSSTLRRLRTLDGRSLGPDEEPPVLRSTIDKNSRFASNSSNVNPPETIIASEAKPEKLGTQAPPKERESFPALQTAQTNQSSKSKIPTKPTSKKTIIATVSDREEVEAAPEENSRTKEEEEQARKAEELARKEEQLRKERAEAEMKEQLRLEQKAKAREAEERKRRKADKAQARAEYRTQKEAELREKKKLKKEKKKASTTSDTTNGVVEGDSAPAADSILPENALQPESPAVTASKRPSRPLIAAKQYNKIQPLPLPLRNKGKKRMGTWMWVLLTSLLVLALFLAGNYFSFSFSLP